MSKKIQLDFESTRARLLELADASPETHASCTYDECIVGCLLAEKMDGQQWSELIREYNSTTILSIISDDRTPETFQIVTDSSETTNLLGIAQAQQDSGYSWGTVAEHIREDYPDD